MTHTALTEAPPITPFEHRLMVCSALEQTRALLPYLNAEGLHEVRAWLRHPDTLHVLAGTQAAVLRGYLLDAICRRLVELTHYTPTTSSAWATCCLTSLRPSTALR